jgi:hypothetical protein
LDLLDPGLPQRKQAYAHAVEDTRRPKRPSISHPAQINFSTQGFTYNGSAVATGDSASSTYIRAETHQRRRYPTATQYPTTPESATNSSNLTYAAQDNFSTDSVSIDNVEAPLVTAFAAQASQVSPAWRPGPGSAQMNFGLQAWHQWTSIMTGNTGQLEPQDCYSANALMQPHGRDMGNETADNSQGLIAVESDALKDE